MSFPELRLPDRRGRQVALALVLGTALNLAQPPLFIWPALFVLWPLLALLAARARDARRAALIGFAAGLGYFAVGTYWIGEAFVIEAARKWWLLPLAPLAILSLSAVLAAFWAGAFWAVRRIGARGWRLPLAMGLALLLSEVARGWALTGFPWALQSYALVDGALGQLGALVGFYALSGLMVATASALAALRPTPVLVAVALTGAAWLWGAARLEAPVSGDGPVIRLVQPDIAQDEKWKPGSRAAIFRRLLDLTAAPPEGDPPALVVWPEVAVTFLIDDSAEAITQATGAAGGAALAIGAVRLEDGAYFNSLFGYAPDGARFMTYDKRHLTPFGEYVPYAWVLGRIGLGTLGDGLSGFTPGAGAGVFAPPGLPPVAPLICYDAVFPGETRDGAAGAQWLLQVTNDSWFGHGAGPLQHLAIARARAIENGLPLARAANGGVSVMIDARGRVVARLGIGRMGVLDAGLPMAAPGTPYAALGDATWVALATLLLGAPCAPLAIRRRLRRIKR